jgi:hypothetical protein
MSAQENLSPRQFTTAQRKSMIAMHNDTADRLAHHKRMMEEHSRWLDENPGKRREASDIAAEFEVYMANLRDDLGMQATDAAGHLMD